jgi:cobalt-zinc-cadmium efflux system protein
VVPPEDWLNRLSYSKRVRRKSPSQPGPCSRTVSLFRVSMSSTPPEDDVTQPLGSASHSAASPHADQSAAGAAHAPAASAHSAHVHTHCSGSATHDHASHWRSANQRQLAVALALASIYMLAEVVGGFVTGSLALLSDAGHMFSDVAALALSYAAISVARRAAGPRRSFGWHRVEILAALINGSALFVVIMIIFSEAIQRWVQPQPVYSPGMMLVAAGGLVVNALMLWVLHGGRDSDLNMRGAWLHVLADTLGSVAALAAGGLIAVFGWLWADPAASFLIGSLVLFSSLRLVREAVSVLLESVPKDIDIDAVRDSLAGVPGVQQVTDLHVWSITTGLTCLLAHIVPETSGNDLETTASRSTPQHTHSALLARLHQTLQERFPIQHITIQIEPSGFTPAVCAAHSRPAHLAMEADRYGANQAGGDE